MAADSASFAAGWDFTCGIREGNALWCRGDNGSTTSQFLPRQITA